MAEECLICSAPLKYLNSGEMMECVLCKKKENSKTCCINGHYICSECHTKGIEDVLSICIDEPSKNPVDIIEKLMSLSFCHMHGPEHHIMVGAALLTAYKNAGGEVDLPSALIEMQSRGREVPGGACGFWGACGAAISAGIFVSIISKATPLSGKEWGLSNLMTAQALKRIGETGGPRCCKRNSYFSLLEAVDFVAENFGISMERTYPVCSRSAQNAQCLAKRCPFVKKA